MLANRTGKLDDLLQVEQELARFQAEIDAARSELAAMRGRVAMSRLTLTYDSRPPLAAPGAWTPLSEDLRGATGLFAANLGALVSLLAALTPFVVVVALAGGLILAVRRTRRRNPPAPLEPPLS